MKLKGFRLVYHPDIPKNIAEKVLLIEKERMIQGYGCRRESLAFYRRGILGKVIKSNVDSRGGFNSVYQVEPDESITFRRLCKNRRVFGLVPVRLLDSKGGEFDLNQCMCAMHLGGQKCVVRGGFNEKDYIHYFTTGKIKG
jgi:hypothetical protein